MKSAVQLDPASTNAPPEAPGREHEARHHGMPPFRRLTTLLRAEKRDLWAAVIYSVFIGLLSLALPLATQSLVNTIAFGSLLQPVAVLTILVFAFLIFSAVLQTCRTWLVEMIQRRIFVRVCGESAHRLISARIDAFDHHYGPEMVNRVLEVVTVQKAAAMLLIDGLSVLMQTAMGMGLLAAYHPLLALLDSVLVVGIVIVLFVLGIGAVGTAVNESKAKYSMVAWMEEIARFPVTFKSPQGRQFALRRTDEMVQDYLKYRSLHFRILLRQIVGSLTLQAVASALLLGVGGYLVIQRELTLGQLIAAELVLALVVSGFTKFGKHLEIFYDLLAGLDKLGYLTDLPSERSGHERLLSKGRGAAIALRNLSFAYPHHGNENHRPLLDHVQWEIPSGARIGLLAPTGEGKSTLVDVIFGLRQPTAGHIEIDGRDYRDVSLDAIRGDVAVVRTAEIFEGTVAENLRLGNPDVDTGRMRAALAAVNLLEDVLALPEGLNAKLYTGGLPLSPGQALRLTLARAIVMQPRLLILDDCLEHLDDLHEKEVMLRMLVDSAQPWTLLIASAAVDDIEVCSRRYELRGGRVEELRY